MWPVDSTKTVNPTHYRHNRVITANVLVGGIISEMPPGTSPLVGGPNLTSQPLIDGFSPVRE